MPGAWSLVKTTPESVVRRAIPEWLEGGRLGTPKAAANWLDVVRTLFDNDRVWEGWV